MLTRIRDKFWYCKFLHFEEGEKMINDDKMIEELKSVKRGIYYLVGKLSGAKGGAEEYSRLREKGFTDEEIALMFGITESGVVSGISLLKLRKGKRGNPRKSKTT